MLSALTVIMACASTPDALTLPPDQHFERANSLLQDRKWTEAITAFEQFVIQYPTHPRVQEARFGLGEAYFGKKEYVTAANEFSRLANDYPAGPFADDARFKVCESYYELSPKPQLDQQYTRSAFEHCESLISYYSTSEFIPRAREMMAELRRKLAEKEFQAGEFYFERNAYDSAIIYYEATARDYPESAVAPRALLRLLQTYQKIGYREEADATQARLLKDYPDSPEARGLRQAPAALPPQYSG
jgi:outer membrane protein assembly factor BamD